MSRSQIQRLVRADAVSVDQATSIDRAITTVREFTPTDDGVSVYYVYVTDDDELVGVVSMRELLNAEDTDTVSTIMSTDLVTIGTDDSLQEAARRFVESRFAVLPVVDDSGQFVGTVRANDVIDALDEQTTKQLFKQAGLWMR